MSDVTNCVTSLKKVVQDLRASGSTDGQLQMANPVARYACILYCNLRKSDMDIGILL